METLDVAQYKLTERRIARLTLAVGGAAAAGACWLISIRFGAGVLIGSLLAWIGFRWLEGALDVLLQIATAKAGTERPRVRLAAALRILGRYVLIGAVVYVNFAFFGVPVLSMLAGMCALGTATMLASLYELFRPAA